MTIKRFQITALELWSCTEVFAAEDKNEAILRMEDALAQGRFKDSDFHFHSGVGTELWEAEEI